MIASLLPGLRELRAPLAAGYLWLLAGWLTFGPVVPEASSATGVWKDMYRLGEGAGKSGILAAATFAAYIIGIFNERIAYLLVRRFQSIRTRRAGVIATFWPDDILRGVVTDTLVSRYWSSDSFRGEVQEKVTLTWLLRLLDIRPDFISDISVLRQLLESKQSEWTPEYHSRFEEERRSFIHELEHNRNGLGWLLRELINVEGTIDELRQDLLLIPDRLVGKEPAIHERWDRLRAESEFRISVALPLLTLAVILAIRLHPIFAVLVFPFGYLVHDGLEKSRAATIQLAESLRAGRASSPVIDRLKTGEPLWRTDPRYR